MERLQKKRYQIAVICVLTALAYSNTFGNEFVFDDKVLIEGNTFIRDLGNIPNVFLSDFFRRSIMEKGGIGYYRPVVTLSYMLDYMLWGPNPAGYHLTNLIFHLLNTVLVYLVVDSLYKKKYVALATGLMFGLHPIHTEAVTWISGRTETISAFFYLLALLCYVKWMRKAERKYLAASIGSFVLALLSKETALTLPLVLVLVGYVFKVKRRSNPQAYDVFFFIALLFLFVRYLILGQTISWLGGDRDYYFELLFESPHLFVVNLCVLLSYYTRLLALPAGLSLDHSIPYQETVFSPAAIGCFLATAAALYFVFRSWKMMGKRHVFFTVSFSLITVLPVLHVVPIRYVLAERFLYLPSIGFCLLVAHILTKLAEERPTRKMALTVLIVINVFYLNQTYVRNADYRDEFLLWRKTVETSPESYMGHVNLGIIYAERELIASAVKELERAVELNPLGEAAHDILGTLYSDSGRVDEALEEHKKAVTINPKYARGYYNLGVTYERKGMLNESAAAYRRVIALDPYDANAHNNLGVVLSQMNKTSEAIQEFQKAIESNPEHALAHNNLGAAYAREGRLGEAILEFKAAISLNPSYIDTYHNLAHTYRLVGEHELAEQVSGVAEIMV